MRGVSMFRFGPELEPAFPPFEYRPSGAASILEPVMAQREHRAKCVAAPPNGYGSIVFPTTAVVGKQYEVKVTLPPAPADESIDRQREWWAALPASAKADFLVVLTLATTDAFDVSDRTQELRLGTVGRVVGTVFLVRPLAGGKHTLRLELQYPGAEDRASFSQAVKVRSRLLDVVQRAGVVVGVIGGILAVLRVLGWL